MRLRWTSILIVASLVVSSCDNDDVAGPIDSPALTTEEQIIADCYTLRDALEAFAAENGGVYPYNFTDQSDAGNQFITFLPGGTRFTNRYTGLVTTPTFVDPQWPGEIGLHRFPTWNATGYRIIGRGRYGELIRLENLSTIDPRAITAFDSVLANCDTTVAAAEEFARRTGQYASDVSADGWRDFGFTMTHLLPGGWLLTNPFWGGQDSPVDGSAAAPGQIGYQPQDWDGDGLWDGYIIDALGADGATVVAVRTRGSEEDEHVRNMAFRLRSAVEDFASQNGGEYPRDIDTDETPAGDTVLELASCTCANPYTGAPAFRNGLATSRGEVGYVPLEYNGIVVGYVINALGLFDVELERFEVLTN